MRHLTLPRVRPPGSVAATVLGLAGVLSLAGCGDDKALLKRLDEANSKSVECSRDVSRLTAEVESLKRQLADAQAQAAKSKTVVGENTFDLMGQVHGDHAASKPPKEEELTLGKGDLDVKKANTIVFGGAKALVACYERALKKNSSLQAKSGLPVTLSLVIKPTGVVQAAQVAPAVDPDMVSCMKQTAMRWKFAPFAGEPVTYEQKLTLTPKI